MRRSLALCIATLGLAFASLTAVHTAAQPSQDVAGGFEWARVGS